MAKNQKSYTLEFKQKIVDLHCQAGKGVTELSNEFGTCCSFRYRDCFIKGVQSTSKENEGAWNWKWNIKKSYCHIRKKSIAEYVSFIQDNIDKYTVKQMCFALKFPRSTYYAAINHVPSRREQEYNRFSEEVLSVYNEYKERYGAIKIHRELNDRNISPCD